MMGSWDPTHASGRGFCSVQSQLTALGRGRGVHITVSCRHDRARVSSAAQVRPSRSSVDSFLMKTAKYNFRDKCFQRQLLTIHKCHKTWFKTQSPYSLGVWSVRSGQTDQCLPPWLVGRGPFSGHGAGVLSPALVNGQADVKA